jgi:hypothetical protein
MIRFALQCDRGHAFEAWFSSGASSDEQEVARAIVCPDCGSYAVSKAPMAPAVLRGGGESAPSGPDEKERKQNYAVLKGLREYLKTNAEDVGQAFPEEARKIHYGEAEARSIYGEATADEAKTLWEEEIPVVPLPPLPEEHN